MLYSDAPFIYDDYIVLTIIPKISKKTIVFLKSSPEVDSRDYQSFSLSGNFSDWINLFRPIEGNLIQMLHFFFAVAFSASPLILYVPPIRSLNFFVQTIEDLLRESRVNSGRLYPRLRHAFSRILNCMLCNDSR